MSRFFEKVESIRCVNCKIDRMISDSEPEKKIRPASLLTLFHSRKIAYHVAICAHHIFRYAASP